MEVLIAQAAAGSAAAGVDIPNLVIQGGSFGAFLWIVRWMMTKFTDDQEDMRVQHKEDSKAIQDSQTATTLSIMAMTKQLLTHDLTVSGLNPDAGADFEGRDSKALSKYNEICADIEKIEGHLRAMLMPRVTA